MFRKLREQVILLLAGESTIVVNAKIEGKLFGKGNYQVTRKSELTGDEENEK